MAILLKVNQQAVEIEPKNGKCFELEELQGYVGGYIEYVRLDGNMQMVVNEDGLGLKLKPNPAASMTAQRLIVGDAVVLSPSEGR
jgi:hypothetical protein